MDTVTVRLMKERRYEMVPIDKIVIINSRNREQTQFKENVRSINSVGLYKPILVNMRNLKSTGCYELVCGEGRLLAHKELKKTEVRAEVVDIDRGTAQLMTLGENIARSRMPSIEYGKAIKEMSDLGMSMDQLCAITGKQPDYIKSFIRLLEQGEERLIKGVEDNVFSLMFALNVAQSTDRSVQHLLMDAFDNGVVNSANLGRIRQIIEDRQEKGRELSGKKPPPALYTVDKLKGDIRQIIRQKESFVYEAGQKENRLFRMLLSLKTLRADSGFSDLVRKEGLTEDLQLKGTYEI